MRTMRTFLALILVLVGTAELALSKDGPPPPRILSPYFFVEGANPGTRLVSAEIHRCRSQH
jgi:hypothetical protein